MRRLMVKGRRTLMGRMSNLLVVRKTGCTIKMCYA